jgi:tRNA dimethylallyltransferase
MNKTIVVVCGPTASGKTALAIAVASYYKTVVLSADSRQFYSEMSIGTAKPTTEELAQVPHFFIGHRSIQQPYDVGQFESEVLSLLADLFTKHDVVVLCGGTGLYVKAILEGLDTFPAIEEAVKQQVVADFENKGLAFLQAELQLKDADYFESVDRANPHRLIRALAVIRQSGKPFSSFLSQEKKNRDFKVIKIGIEMERTVLYERINKRVLQMMQDGLLQEVKSLVNYQHLNTLQTVGYTELFGYLQGETSLEEAVQKIQQHTRNYAKRQLTWFKRDSAIHWRKPMELQQIGAFIDQKLNELHNPEVRDL